MKKKWRRGIAIAVALLLLLSVIPLQRAGIVKAAGPDVTVTDYTDNGQGMNYDIPAGTYGTITVPAGYHLTIAGAVTADSLIIEGEGTVHILGEGSLTCSNIQPAAGSEGVPGGFIQFETQDKIPSGMQVYELYFNEGNNQEELRDITEETWPGDWFFVDFEYVAGANNGANCWILVPGDEPEDEPLEAETLQWDRLKEELSQRQFAFGDINKDNTADETDIKRGISRILVDGFSVGEGRYQREGEVIGLERHRAENGDIISEKFEANIQKLESLATVAAEGNSITVTDSGNTTHTLSSYKITYTIDQVWDFAEEGNPQQVTLEEPIIFSAYVYLIPSADFPTGADHASWEQVIFRVGNQYFIRDCHEARGDGDAGNESELEVFEGMNAKAIILVADYNSKEEISAFGNYAQLTGEFSDASSESFFASGFGTPGDDLDYLGDKVVVYKPSFKGVTIQGTGATVTPLAWTVESSMSIADSGENTQTSLFFGYPKVSLKAVTDAEVAGLSVKGIDSVKILNNIPEEAVSVTGPDADGKIEITFHSDFYDVVPVEITYRKADGSLEAGVTTINRVGIVVQGAPSPGDTHIVQIMHGHEGGEPILNNGVAYDMAVYATYYFPENASGSVSDVSLFVTLTYRDGRVERKVIETTEFTPIKTSQHGHNAAAMSDYVIYCGDRDGAPVKVEAIAVTNKGADGRYQGAKLGAGKGVSFNVNTEE